MITSFFLKKEYMKRVLNNVKINNLVLDLVKINGVRTIRHVKQDGTMPQLLNPTVLNQELIQKHYF